VKLRVDVVVAIVVALPILLVRAPPMVDFCGHEAIVGVLRHWGDPAYLTGTLYKLNLGHPNQLQYLIAWPFALVLGSTKGFEVAVAVAVASVVLGAARLAEHLRRPRWVALYAVPVALGFYFQWGMIANLLGTGALLTALPSLDRYARDPQPRAIPRMLAWCVLLYLAHEIALVVATVALACFALRAFTARRALFCAVPCAFALGLVLVQLELQQLSAQNLGFILVNLGFGARLRGVPEVVVGYQAETATLWLLFAFVAAPLALARVVPVRAGAEPMARPMVWPYVGLAAVLAVLYFVIPNSYGGVFYFSHRFLPIGWTLLAVVAFKPDVEYPRVFRLAACGVPFALLALLLPSFLACDASMRELDSLIGTVAPGSAVATIELDPVHGGTINAEGFSARMAQGHIVAMRGGRALSDYTQSPISPAFLRPERRWDQMIVATFLDPVGIYPRPALSHFRYLVIHTQEPAVQAAAAHVLEPVARVAAAGPSWVVFESREAVIPADAPEGTYPAPLGETLRAGLVAAFHPEGH
jgi:hypothetical protein